MDNEIDNKSSLAVKAHHRQDFDMPSERYPDAEPKDTYFPGHDDFQNGIIEHNSKESQNCTFYVQATDGQIEDAKNHEASFLSGFATDANECKRAVDPNTGKLDANVLSDRLQTAPGHAEKTDPWSYRSNVAAFDVNWDELNKSDNKNLKDRLCNPDGLSPDSNDIKVAYGKAQANDHWGTGGGNQYYIDKQTFNDAVNRGIFVYNEDKSYRECKGNLQRTDISDETMRRMNEIRETNIKETLSSCQDKNAVTAIDKAKSLNEVTPEKAKEINSAVAPQGDYMARPDQKYHYSQSEGNSQKADTANINLRDNNIKANEIRAGPGNSESKADFSSVKSSELKPKSSEQDAAFSPVSKGELKTAPNQKESFQPVTADDLKGKADSDGFSKGNKSENAIDRAGSSLSSSRATAETNNSGMGI